MSDAVIIDAVRTPLGRGRPGGALAGVHPVDRLAHPLAAGYPERVPATTVDRQCGSAHQAIHFAAQGVLAGTYDIVVAGGSR
jgi:acetyl-CoA acyltransferase